MLARKRARNLEQRGRGAAAHARSTPDRGALALLPCAHGAGARQSGLPTPGRRVDGTSSLELADLPAQGRSGKSLFYLLVALLRIRSPRSAIGRGVRRSARHGLTSPRGVITCASARAGTEPSRCWPGRSTLTGRLFIVEVSVRTGGLFRAVAPYRHHERAGARRAQGDLQPGRRLIAKEPGGHVDMGDSDRCRARPHREDSRDGRRRIVLSLEREVVLCKQDPCCLHPG